MGFILFAFICLIIALAFMCMYYSTKSSHQCDHILRTEQALADRDEQISLLKTALSTTQADAGIGEMKRRTDEWKKPVDNKTPENEGIILKPEVKIVDAPCETCDTGVLLKCGFKKCIVRWSNGKTEKIAKARVQELLLEGKLRIGTKANVTLHTPS